MKWSILVYDDATRSDHEVIEWEMDYDRDKGADHERVLRWILAAMMQKDLEGVEKLCME